MMPLFGRAPILLGLAAFAALAACSSAAGQHTAAPATIEKLDVPRYMGTWYEVARYPNKFQEKCVGESRAEYNLQDDGTIRVINRCRLANGEMNEAIGTARQVGDAKLQVRFAPAWLSWLPSVWGDYWIIELDADYSLVAISDPRREYLWILSRTPKAEPQALQAMKKRLEAKGFDLSPLIAEARS